MDYGGDFSGRQVRLTKYGAKTALFKGRMAWNEIEEIQALDSFLC